MRIAYTQDNGTVAIVGAAPKAHLEKLFGPLSDEQYKAHVRKRALPEYANDAIELPDDFELPDRAKRQFWRIKGRRLIVDENSD